MFPLKLFDLPRPEIFSYTKEEMLAEIIKLKLLIINIKLQP